MLPDVSIMDVSNNAPWPQRSDDSGKIDAHISVANCCQPTSMWNMVHDISGLTAGSPKIVAVVSCEAARLLVSGLDALDLRPPLGKSKLLVALRTKTARNM